jgi:hypothetical protein
MDLEDKLQTKQQAPPSDAICGQISGECDAAVVVEFSALEAAGGYVVQNGIRNAEKLNVHDIESLSLELQLHPFIDVYVFEDGQVRRADCCPRRLLREAPANGVPKKVAAVGSLYIQ